MEALAAVRRGGAAAAVGAPASIARLPLAIAALLSASLGAVVVGARRRRSSATGAPALAESGAGTGHDHGAVALLALGMAADVALIEPLGFVVAGALLFVVAGWAFGERRVLRSALLGLSFTASVFLVFRSALGVPLPVGRLWEWLR